MNAISRRLDSLEAYTSWFVVRLLLLAGFSWSLNAAEFVLFTYTRTTISKSVHLTTYALEGLGGGLFIGAVVGAPLFGRIADAKGRRWALLLAKTLSLLGLVLSIMARRGIELIGARVLAGIGFGGELPVAAVLMHELAPKPMRNRMVASLYAFTGTGGIVGLALALNVTPRLGWRIAYMVLSGSVFYVGVLSFLLMESPKWLACSGRVADATRCIEKLERAHGTRMIYDLAMVQGTSTLTLKDLQVENSVETVKTFVRHKPLCAAKLWGMWVVMELAGYALGLYLPVVISLWGFNMFSRWVTTVLLGLAQIVGSVLASMVMEEVGAKKLLVRCAASAASVAVILSYAPWNGPVVVVGTCAVSALLAAAWGCVLVSAPTNFSTEVRGRGVGYAFGFSRLAAVIGFWLYPRMFNLWRMSVPAIAWTFAVLLVLVVLWFALPLEHNNAQCKDLEVPTDRKIKDKVTLDDSTESENPLLSQRHNKKE